MVTSRPDFRRACWQVGIDPAHIPDLAAPSPGEVNHAVEPFFAPVVPMSDENWAWLREAVPYRFGRLPDERDRQYLDALRTLVRNGRGELNWTLLRSSYGSCNAVRMKWLHWNEAGKFAKLYERAQGRAITIELLDDLRRLAIHERAYTERITLQRGYRVVNKQKKVGEDARHIAGKNAFSPP